MSIPVTSFPLIKLGISAHQSRPKMSFFQRYRYTNFIDLAEPVLSACDVLAIRTLEGCPYNDHWAAILHSFDLITLFKLSLHSDTLFSVVMAYVHKNQPLRGNAFELGVGGHDDLLSALPVELLLSIVPELVLGDRLALSRTSRKFRATCARELQACVANILARFHLGHAEIRLMQAATYTIMGGQCIPHLVDYSFAPPNLEFIAPDAAYSSVIRFLELATGIDPRHNIFNNLYTPEGTDDSAEYRTSATDAQIIRVSRSITDSALDSVTYSPLSHLFGAVTHYGVWLAYTQTSTRGMTIPNRDCLDFSDPTTDDRIEASVTHSQSHFEVRYNLEPAHECGRSWECPATPRTTVDEGCLSLFFPSPPMGETSLPSSVYPTLSVMPWSLGERSCRWGLKHHLEDAGYFDYEVRGRFDGYERWKRQFEHALSL